MSYDIVKEKVPHFHRRLGDRVIAGSNNVTMIFGTDRAFPGEADVSSGYGDQVGAGSWHITLGRDSESPNFETDKSYMYLSMKTNADTNLALDTVEFSSNDVPAALLKSDCIRFVARKDMKLHVNKTYMTLDGTKKVVIGVPSDGSILLGSQATEQLIFGNKHMATFNDLVSIVNALVDAFNKHTHIGYSGVTTTTPLPPPALKATEMPSADLSTISKTK